MAFVDLGLDLQLRIYSTAEHFERFVFFLYHKTNRNTSVNQLMKELFTKGCSIEKKLPTPGVFPQHPKRALHQECVCVCVWGGGGGGEFLGNPHIKVIPHQVGRSRMLWNWGWFVIWWSTGRWNLIFFIVLFVFHLCYFLVLFIIFLWSSIFSKSSINARKFSKFNSISRSSTTNLYIFKCFQYLVLSPKNLIASGNFWQKWHIVAEFFKTFQISPQI